MIDWFETYLALHGERTADIAVAVCAVLACAGIAPAPLLAFIFLYAFVRIYSGIYEDDDGC